MSKNLLHKSKLDAFKAWLDEKGIEHRPARGEYQVLQIKTKNGQWQCVFDRLDAPEHYTVAWPLEPIVHRFIRDRRTATRASIADTAGAKPCDMGVGCDESGVCFAEANGEPDRCSKFGVSETQRVAADLFNAREVIAAMILEHEDGGLTDSVIQRARDIVYSPISIAAAPAPSVADAKPLPFDGLTEEFTEEVARLANDGPGIREAIQGALASCNAVVTPADSDSVADAAGASDKPLTDAQIEAGWRQTFSTDNPYCPCNLKSFTKAVRWAERAKEQK